MDKEKGICFPFGATSQKDGINFAIYAKLPTSVKINFYNEDNHQQPFESILLDANENKTGDIWHIFVKGLPPTFVYSYELKLPDQDENINFVVDPYTKSIASDPIWHKESRKEFTYKPMNKYISHEFDWEGDRPLKIPKKDLVIYEMHVRGFTCHPTSNTQFPGTFRGIIEKIPYLLDLGINAVELMPIQEFCEEDVIQANPETGQKLHNYFGYSTVNFFSLMNRYASQSKADQAVLEFKTLVKELHKNGIEVILDIVFNHTFEGNEKGPKHSYKALEPSAYYILNAEQNHMNFSGCGNTFNCNHPISRELIINVLRYWVLEYHIDGFRFDLASIFSRGKDGAPLDNAPLLEFISVDPVLGSVKLIAEPWDAGGLYELGKFSALSDRWSEWNGKFQTTTREFIKGSQDQKKSFAGALCAYQETFPRSPYSSVNYVVAHDGFSLADLVSFNHKNNIANGENNIDGNDNNSSWNCGIDGDTTNKRILNTRAKQMRNFHLALMVSQGTPMMLMGDEYGHTKKGNNNPWCQDNELNWFLWDKIAENNDFFKFYRFLIHFRKNEPLLRFDHRLTENEIKWHGINPNEPEWDKDNKFVSFTLHEPSGDPGIYIAFNSSHSFQNITIPDCGEKRSWYFVILTQNLPPNDFYENYSQHKLESNIFRISPYSSILLKSLPNESARA